MAGAFASYAIGSAEETKTIHGLVGVSISLGCLVLVLSLVIAWPADDPPEFVVVGKSVTVPAVGDPLGGAVVGYEIPGTAVTVDCKVDVAGRTWFKLAQFPVSWLPGRALRPPSGVSSLDVPRC